VAKTLQTAVDGGKAVFVTVYNIITGPPKELYGFIAVVVAILCLLIYLNRRWVEARPN
jgi:hypothetical protein